MELKRMAEDRKEMRNEQTTIKPEPDKLSSFSAANNQDKMGVFFATKKGDMVRTDAPNMISSQGPNMTIRGCND